jgi:hypothetical protein
LFFKELQNENDLLYLPVPCVVIETVGKGHRFFFGDFISASKILIISIL